MNRDELFEFVSDNLMDTQEVMDHLDISRQRLYDLIKKDILVPLRKGVYLKKDVEIRKAEQGDLREKYYRPRKD